MGFRGFGRTEDPQVLKAMEADYTPAAVAVQLLLVLRQLLGVDPDNALDPSAGSGVWGRALRAVFPRARLHGVEARLREESNLRLAYDDHEMCRYEDRRRRGRVDLVVGNPPFTAMGVWPALARARDLRPGGVVALLNQSSWGHAAGTQAGVRTWAPRYQLRIGARVAYRGDAKADQRDQSLWVWVDGPHEGPGWRTIQLPPLPTELRRWAPSTLPGVQPLLGSLVHRVSRYTDLG